MILISSPSPTQKTLLLATLARRVGEEVRYRGGGALSGHPGWDWGGGGRGRGGFLSPFLLGSISSLKVTDIRQVIF